MSRPNIPRRWPAAVAAAVLLLAGAAAGVAQPAERPVLRTLESQLDELQRTTTLAVDDPLAVFAFVLESLPAEVKVYPTENYYYFGFLHDGVPYSGNLRIEIGEGGMASLHFAYYRTESEWQPEENARQLVLDEARGVKLEKLAPLRYRVRYRDNSVVFVLNDLSQVKPGADALAPDERFIGPVFDDSGVRFLLVYNAKLKLFLYILDESGKTTERLLPAKAEDRIVIGARTGFAYYRDDRRPRKILIGVYEDELRLNTHFDGPFDQLPDNFIEGETLRAAILDMRPDLKGKIDRYGRMQGGKVRFAIKPYLGYAARRDLDNFRHCARRLRHRPGYYNCFSVETPEAGYRR